MNSKNLPRKLICGVNDLATTHPEIASQAEGWDPTTVSQGSGLKKKWRCDEGHQWSAKIQNRTRGVGCPVCANWRIEMEVNSLLTLHPSIAQSADGWDPSKYGAGSARKMKWRCSQGHSFYMRINTRVRGNSCNICTGRVVLAGFNDLSTKNPEVALQADGWDPKKIYFCSSKKMKWICSKGHKWEASVVQRVKLGSGCPFCGGLKAISGESDLQTTHPEIAREAHLWNPRLYKAGSSKKMLWKCLLGHIYSETPNARTRVDTPRSCPYCSGRKVLANFNDLATTHSELAALAYGWDPTKVSKGMVKKLRWRCHKGHEWIDSPNHIVKKKIPCPVCSNHEIRIYVNDLATSHPELAKQAFGWDPTKYGRGNSNKFLKWKCPLGHIWSASIINRTSHKTGCPVCAGQKLWPGYNDLKTVDPNLANEAFGWDPSKTLAGGDTKRKWKCANGHIWLTPIRARLDGRGCPSCAKFGFDPNKDAILYLMENDQMQLLKIGITNAPQNRITLHRQRGWTLLETWGPADGLLVKNWESSILEYLKSVKARMANELPGVRFDGYSESWIKSSTSITSLKDLMDKAKDF